MLIVVDTGRVTTKAAAMIDGEIAQVSFPSAAPRGLIHDNAAGVYSIGKPSAAFQIYSVLARTQGIIPVPELSYLAPDNHYRRVLIEHAMVRLGAKGATNIILTRPAPDLFPDGEDCTSERREGEAQLLKMVVATITAPSERPAPSPWKLGQVTVSPETVWAIYDLAISSMGAAKDDLAEFARNHVEVGATVAVVDFGAHETRVHYVEWTGEALPIMDLNRYRIVGIGTQHVADVIDGRFEVAHGYCDVIDLCRLFADPTITLAGVKTDVAELIGASAREVAGVMMKAGLDHLKAEVEAKTVDHVLMVGGGAHVLGGIVAEGLPADAVLAVADPCMAPVRGLLKARAASAGEGGRS